MAMCYDMRRFEKIAEEKKRSKKEKEVDFVVNKMEEIRVRNCTEKSREK
jgi:hypothetical protein